MFQRCSLYRLFDSLKTLRKYRNVSEIDKNVVKRFVTSIEIWHSPAFERRALVPFVWIDEKKWHSQGTCPILDAFIAGPSVRGQRFGNSTCQMSKLTWSWLHDQNSKAGSAQELTISRFALFTKQNPGNAPLRPLWSTKYHAFVMSWRPEVKLRLPAFCSDPNSLSTLTTGKYYITHRDGIFFPQERFTWAAQRQIPSWWNLFHERMIVNARRRRLQSSPRTPRSLTTRPHISPSPFSAILTILSPVVSCSVHGETDFEVWRPPLSNSGECLYRQWGQVGSSRWCLGGPGFFIIARSSLRLERTLCLWLRKRVYRDIWRTSTSISSGLQGFQLADIFGSG